MDQYKHCYQACDWTALGCVGCCLTSQTLVRSGAASDSVEKPPSRSGRCASQRAVVQAEDKGAQVHPSITAIETRRLLCAASLSGSGGNGMWYIPYTRYLTYHTDGARVALRCVALTKVENSIWCSPVRPDARELLPQTLGPLQRGIA